MRADTRSRRPRDRERERALWAWEQISKVRKQSNQGKYAGLVRKLPTLLQVNGLGQTAAFLAAKGGIGRSSRSEGDNPHGILYRQLEDYLRMLLERERAGREMMEIILNLSPSRYRRVSREIQIVAGWLKRFADAELVEEE